jgi:hypothetical protein
MAGSIYRTLPSRGGSSRSDSNGGHGTPPPNVGAGNPPIKRPMPSAGSINDMTRRESGQTITPNN